MSTEKNGEIISTVENVDYLPDNRYSDGSIPFYNIEKDIQGWIDLKGRKIYINNDGENIGGFFDKIDEAYIEDELLIVQKYGKYYLMNTNGEFLTDTEYDVIRGYNNFIEDSEETSGTIKDILINNYYFNPNTAQLPEEIIQSNIFKNYSCINKINND